MARQKALPGIEIAKIPELHRAGANFLRKRNAHLDAKKAMDKAKERVVAVMHENEKALRNKDTGIIEYRHGDMSITLMASEQVKVVRGGDAPAVEEAEDGEDEE